ncbi:hypothetical protein APE_0542.1 [Aeropyrum pernix K1]|uniref:ArnR1-like winged helix-turn-helix domain-containing protein n=1 Tax=Aeropyrum pernix (strain ATCC 700893 / DSM 11879 / JCM 9820 / NBRC 100138 / K1) TaxID=272557 RepID=Q9YEN6_AERPE|nr:hypothetical protein [Aeropyrum pernix]BAA79510.2 hypothetical protein APE_0542.1 [Aeropyrum pernix K1]
MARPVEAVKRLLERWLEGRRRGYVLTLVALRRLEERGEEATVERVREEGLRILERTEGRIDWGVTRDEYTVNMVSSVLRELAESGLVEMVDGGRSIVRYRIARDAEEEFLSSFGHLLQLVRMPK